MAYLGFLDLFLYNTAAMMQTTTSSATEIVETNTAVKTIPLSVLSSLVGDTLAKRQLHNLDFIYVDMCIFQGLFGTNKKHIRMHVNISITNYI